MSIYTSDYLKGISNKKSYDFQNKIFESRKATTFDIFLSHSFLDKSVIEGLYLELTNLGFSVYVDWIIDPTLDRANVTKESATLVRNRMKSSRSLLLAISMNAALSKWMPWELGFIDGKTTKCAIIPISENLPVKTFKGAEYLQLYPYVKQAEIGLARSLYLIESSHYYISFTDWLRRGLQPTFQHINIDTQ